MTTALAENNLTRSARRSPRQRKSKRIGGITFEVIQKRDGGYAAWSHEQRIYTDSADLEGLYSDITTGLHKNFEGKGPALDEVNLVFYKE